MKSVWSPPWRWTLRISWTLARTWGLLSSRLPSPVGGVLAIPLALLRFPIVLGSRASGTLAAVSPRAALIAVPYQPVRTRIRHQLQLLVIAIVFMLLVAVVLTAVSILLLFIDILVLGDGPLSTVYWALLITGLAVGIVDAVGMFTGLADTRRLSALLITRYPRQSVVVLGSFGAWPRHRGHGRELILAFTTELRRHPRWDVAVAGAVDDRLVALYQRLGLSPISPPDGPPRRILAVELRQGPSVRADRTG